MVLDADGHRYDKTLSDISGMDIEAHGNDVARAIKHVRDWLNANRSQENPLPGASAILADYQAFVSMAPLIISELRLDPHEALPHRDFLHVVEQALPEIEKARRER